MTVCIVEGYNLIMKKITLLSLVIGLVIVSVFGFLLYKKEKIRLCKQQVSSVEFPTTVNYNNSPKYSRVHGLSVVEGVLLVYFETGTPYSEIKKIIENEGGVVIGGVPAVQMTIAKFCETWTDDNVDEIMSSLKKNRAIENISLDIMFSSN